MQHLNQFHHIFYGLPVNLFAIAIGLIVLVLGRKLFWLFIGALGFICGLYFAAYAFYGQPNWIILLTGLAAGAVGAILAVFLQRFAVILSGLFAGGYLILHLVYFFGWHTGWLSWLFFLIGGVVGAVAAATFFDWSLIILSSLTGASMIVRALPLSPMPTILLSIFLAAVGLFVQAGLMLKDRSQHP